jgi:hypothetical protein
MTHTPPPKSCAPVLLRRRGSLCSCVALVPHTHTHTHHTPHSTHTQWQTSTRSRGHRG